MHRLPAQVTNGAQSTMAIGRVCGGARIVLNEVCKSAPNIYTGDKQVAEPGKANIRNLQKMEACRAIHARCPLHLVR